MDHGEIWGRITVSWKGSCLLSGCSACHRPGFCLSQAIASWWLGAGLLSFSCLGLRMSPQPQNSRLAPGPQSCCSVAPCILPLPWSFCSIFLKLSWQVYWNLFIVPSAHLCLDMPFMFFISVFLCCLMGCFLRALLPPSQHIYWVFHYLHLHLLRVSVAHFFSFKCSFIMYAYPSSITVLFFCRLFKMDGEPANPMVLILRSVVSLGSSSFGPMSYVVYNFFFIVRSCSVGIIL